MGYTKYLIYLQYLRTIIGIKIDMSVDLLEKRIDIVLKIVKGPEKDQKGIKKTESILKRILGQKNIREKDLIQANQIVIRVARVINIKVIRTEKGNNHTIFELALN